ncbi:MAG: Crp/Fnr family transcriptional regulator [Pyrinomonadaceae bacterium]
MEREQFILQQDDELEFLYFPETAVLSELHMLDDGRMVEVAIVGRNGSIGLASLYERNRISNCVQVTQAGSLLRMESCLLRKEGRNDPEMPGLLHSSLAAYIRQISLRAVCNMYHSVEERLCTWLLLVRDLGGQSRLHLTHEQIARALGVYRPSVTSIALGMRKRKLIDYSRGGISITDRAGLEATACDCYNEFTRDATPIDTANAC